MLSKYEEQDWTAIRPYGLTKPDKWSRQQPYGAKLHLTTWLQPRLRGLAVKCWDARTCVLTSVAWVLSYGPEFDSWFSRLARYRIRGSESHAATLLCGSSRFFKTLETNGLIGLNPTKGVTGTVQMFPLMDRSGVHPTVIRAHLRHRNTNTTLSDTHSALEEQRSTLESSAVITIIGPLLQ